MAGPSGRGPASLESGAREPPSSLADLRRRLNAGGEDQNVVQIQICLRALCYSVKTGRRPGDTKQILREVTCDFNPKESTAILGHSGCGKTTILNIATQNAAGQISGVISANGFGLTPGLKTLVKLVTQDDTLLPALTVTETLQYGAALRIRGSSEQRTQRISELINVLRLQECQETIIGSCDGERGVSGGQRKRVAVALEMLSSPSVVLLDEPTSGLDSQACEDLCKILKILSGRGQTLACTIHQPSWKSFSYFDQILLMNAGELVYRGKPSDMMHYFEMQGLGSCENENPADFVIRQVQMQVVQRFTSDGLDAQPSSSDLPLLPAGRNYPTAWVNQLRILFARNMRDCLKDRAKFVSICLGKLTKSAVIGIAFWSAGYPNETVSAHTVGSCLFILMMDVCSDNLHDAIGRFFPIKDVFYTEYRNGYYSSAAWFLSYMAYVFIMQFWSAFLLIGPSWLLMRLRLKLDVFLFSLICLFVSGCAAASGGIMCASLAASREQASMMQMLFLLPMILFAGYLIPPDKIPTGGVWFYHIDIMQWGYTILRLKYFEGLTFNDCPIASEKIITFCNCTDAHSVCTGDEYLTSIGVIPEDGLVTRDFIFMCLFVAFTLVPAYFVVYRRARRKSG